MPRFHLPSGPAALRAAASGPYAARPVTVDRLPGPVVSPVGNPNLLPFLRDQEPEVRSSILSRLAVASFICFFLQY